jgi:hypothetical protein
VVMPTTTPAALGGTACHSVPVAVRAGGGRAERSFRFRTEGHSRGCAQQHTRGLVGALNAEWRRIAADPAARATVAAWSSALPALTGCADPSAVVDAVTRRGQDEVLLTLLRLARDGDALAARIALQVMLGSAVRLARRTLGHAQGDLEEALSRSVTALWQVIRNYPLERRTCRPADGISLDVLAALTAAGRSRPAEVPGGLPAELADIPDDEPDDAGRRSEFWSVAHPTAAGACSDEQLVLLLAWGVRRAVVSVEDARLLLRLHSPREPRVTVSCREVAAELGLGHAAVRQRASRATRRLASAVADEAQRAVGAMDAAA